MRSITLVIILLSCSVNADTSKVPSNSIRPFPVRNGDFSLYEGWGRPLYWNINIPKGDCAVKINPQPVGPKNQPSQIDITSVDTGETYVWQDVDLLPGQYQFSVEAKVSGQAEAIVTLRDQSRRLKETLSFETLSFEFNAVTPVSIHLGATGLGTVSYRSVQIRCVKLDGMAVPSANGAEIGRIIVEGAMTPAKEFAVHELQTFIRQMTGNFPGLEGRDCTANGQSIILTTCTFPRFQNAPTDAYYVGMDDRNGKTSSSNVLLAANSDAGVLYAAYDFLKLQGCRWYLPGAVGQEIPQRSSLNAPKNNRLEKPDYDVRGFLIYEMQFFPNGGWVFCHRDEYLDWAVRNRINAIWCGTSSTTDFEPHRGHGHQQSLNHSWPQFLSDDHPEWYALIDGKRQKMHPAGRANQLCVSNAQLRDIVTKKVIEYFDNHPKAKIFALNPNDDVFWCECQECRKLDGDGGTGKWKKQQAGESLSITMADRVLSFVNDIAGRVAKVYPDKIIEVYAYDAYREPPLRETVGPTVLIKYTLWPGSPCNGPILDTRYESNRQLIHILDGWQTAGAKTFGLYDYGNYLYPDCPQFNFYHQRDILKTLHDRWGFRHCLPESANTLAYSPIMFNMRAQMLWNTNSDYKLRIHDICKYFYKAASEPMYEYYIHMENVLLSSHKCEQKRWNPLLMEDFSLATMQQAQTYLDQAMEMAKDDNRVLERVGLAQVGHDYMTITLGSNMSSLSDQDKLFVIGTHKRAKTLAMQYGFRFSQTGSIAMKTLYLKPSVKASLYELPAVWRFKTDLLNAGVKENWPKQSADSSWGEISILKDWTSQGHNYHGVAWYRASFELPKSLVTDLSRKSRSLGLYCGGVDGYADFYLDGVKIGEQKEDVGFMWDKPFIINLPASFDPSLVHEVAVRVEKDRAAAGIYKPVSVVIH